MTNGIPTGHRTALHDRLAALGIETRTVPYPSHRTVEEGKALRGNMTGQFTKNLLLKDKKGSLFMIVADEDRPIDLRRLHVHIGAQGRLGFAPFVRAAMSSEFGSSSTTRTVMSEGCRVIRGPPARRRRRRRPCGGGASRPAWCA